MTLILNIDDTEPLRYAKSRALMRAGFEVIEATSGGEGLTLAETRKPDLMLLDVKLPDINGFEVCRRLKRDHGSMLVLQTSASFVDPADRVAGLEGGADAYLTMPAGADELVASVRALLRLGEAENGLRKTNVTLERRIIDSTKELEQAHNALQSEIRDRELAEEALRQSQKMEVLGQLTGGIAHDFNNLLMAIIGNLEFLLRKLPAGAEKSLRHGERALSGAQCAATLTQRLLAFSRRQSLQPTQVDLDDLVEETAELTRRSSGENIRVVTKHLAKPWPVWCDGNQMVNALLNVAINARDAMPDGGTLSIEVGNVSLGTGDIRAHASLQAGDYVVVVVRDTGTGMPPDVLTQAFDPFFTTKPVGQGTGLGLSMVYGFIKQSDGLARIHSVVGEGTSVYLYLPRMLDKLPGQPAEAEPDMADGGICTGSVLVVEDNPMVRDIVVQVLEDEGFTVLQATDGPRALTLLDASPMVQLLITDVGLPGMNGRQLAETARARRPDLKVPFSTGYAHNTSLGDFESLPGAEVISKPFQLEVLAARVRTMMQEN
jgi:DNA-binding response OmpR family regulator